MNNSNINIYTQTSNSNILQHLEPLLDIDDKDNLIIVNKYDFNTIPTQETNIILNDLEIENILNIDENEYLNNNIPKLKPFFKDDIDLEETIDDKKHIKINQQQYCTNCCKYNHNIKDCKEPVKSYGLLCFYPTPLKLDLFYKLKKTKKNIYDKIKEKTLSRQENNEKVVLYNPQFNNNSYDTKYSYKVIMVQRKHTIGMIELIRGKYDITQPLQELKKYLIKLLNMTTFEEKQLLETNENFDDIRTKLNLARHYYFRNEYDDSKMKFNFIKEQDFGESGNGIQQLLKLSLTTRTSPEWGIPKGRKHQSESDIECAIREFIEETGIEDKYIKVYKNVMPLKEIYKGVNNIIYEHIYYIASLDTSLNLTDYLNNIIGPVSNSYEISNVQLMSQRESINSLREYHMSKKQVIEKGFQIIVNLPYYFE